MARVSREPLLPLVEVIPLLRGVSDGPIVPSLGTVLRWVRRGKRGVRLEACRRRGQLVTSLPAVARFKAAVLSVPEVGWGPV